MILSSEGDEVTSLTPDSAPVEADVRRLTHHRPIVGANVRRLTNPLPYGLSIALVLLSLAIRYPVHAAEPPLDFLYPNGGQRGTEITVDAGGKFESWPVLAWSDHPAVTVSAGDTNGQLKITIAADAPLGPHWIRLYNQDGVSAPRLFDVGILPEISEIDPNNLVTEAQAIATMPLTVNGRLEKNGDVDCYALKVKRGLYLIAAVRAYVLDAPTDAILQLTDTNNYKLAFNHDGSTLDPFLVWKSDRDDPVILKIAGFAYPPQANVAFSGQAAAVYRLSLYTGPYASYLFPLGARPGATNRWEVFGWNLPQISGGNASLSVSLPPEAIPTGVPEFIWHDPMLQNPLWLPIDIEPLVVEAEPNNDPTNAPSLAWPVVVNGRLDPSRDEDRYLITVKKDQKLDLRLDSAALGFPVDGLLRVEDLSGKELTRNDDADKQPDPRLIWKAPAEGTNVVVVSDLFSHGGPDHLYRLRVTEAQPDVEAFVDTSALAVEPGKSVEMKIKFKRLEGFSGKVILQAVDLPSGVVCDTVEAPDKNGDVTLKFVAAADAPPANQPIRVKLLLSETAPEDSTRWATIPVQGKFAEAGDLALNTVSTAWLTIRPAAKQSSP